MRFCLTALLVVVLSGCTLDTRESAPEPGSDRPIIQFLSPVDNTAVLEGTEVQIQLLARDSNGSGVAQVELRIDDEAHAEAAPVEREAVAVFTVDMNWLAQGIGLHPLTATAYRADGTPSTPVTIRLNVIAAVNP